jgi:DNA-binding IclR family transcriptional regulator
MERCSDSMRVVKSQLSHCLALLDVMADGGRGHRLTDLASALDLPKSSMQRLLDHLAGEGWIEQDAGTLQYRLTMRLAVLGQRYLQSAGIADATQGILERLARETGELVRLTVVDQRRLVWIGSAQGAPPGLMYQPSMGGRIVSFATANGKAWLSCLAEQEARAIAIADGIGRDRRDAGPRALASVEGLLADLAMTRERGYAIADEEAEPGVAAVAVAVRGAFDGPVLGTISVAGPVVRIGTARRTALAAMLADAAHHLGRVWPLGSGPSARQPRSAGGSMA